MKVAQYIHTGSDTVSHHVCTREATQEKHKLFEESWEVLVGGPLVRLAASCLLPCSHVVYPGHRLQHYWAQPKHAASGLLQGNVSCYRKPDNAHILVNFLKTLVVCVRFRMKFERGGGWRRQEVEEGGDTQIP
jgi:hypothetical protein